MNKYRQIREECLQANMALATNRLVDLTFGNASVADFDENVFAIKPSGVDYLELTPESIVIVDLAKGHVLEGELRPSSDTPTHRRLLQVLAEHGLRSVVHTHSRHAVSWAQAGRGIPCLGTTHADHFYGEIPVTRPMTPREIQGSYEWETGNVIVERFGETDFARMNAVLVHGHGPFTWGVNGAEAVENAVVLEIVAEMALRTLQINPNAPPISQTLLDKHFLRKHGADAYYGQAK